MQWDSFGEDVVRSIREDRLKNIDAVVLVFDLTDEASLENLMQWNTEIERHADPKRILSKVLVGNKNDLPHSRKVSEDARVPILLG